VLSDPAAAKSMTSRELADACRVAESTVTRFAKEIGLDGYRELKIGIAEALSSGGAAAPGAPASLMEDIDPRDGAEALTDKMAERSARTLVETRKRLDPEQMRRAVDAIAGADTVLFAGAGYSGVACAAGVQRFTRMGKRCIAYADQSAILMGAAIVGARDVVIGVSNSGRTKFVLQALEAGKRSGAQTMLITSYEDAPALRYADIVLFTFVKPTNEGSALFWESTASKTAQLLVLDALYACYAAKHYRRAMDSMEQTYHVVRTTRSRGMGDDSLAIE